MMKILSILIAAAILSGPVQGATFNVTRKDDPVPDGCKAGNCSLREAVIDANQSVTRDTIMLPAGIYLLDLAGFDGSEDVGDLDISSDLDFVGAPSTIDGQNLTRIMDIRSDVNVTLSDLTLRRALSTSNGGAITINGGSLTLDAVTFDDNSNGGRLGGALYTSGDALVNINNCSFLNNKGGSGGAIYAGTGITVRNSVFRDNTVEQRGASVYVSGTTSVARFENVTFDKNIASGSGAGAILFLGRDLFLESVVATGNEVTAGGGGVLFTSGTSHLKQIDITNSLFEGNKAKNGGAIDFGGSIDTLNIRHSSFVNNVVTENGGAIYTTGGFIDLTNDTFSGNQATARGGAIYMYSADLKLHHVTISGGSADSGKSMYLGGFVGISSTELANNLFDGDCNVTNADTVTSLGGNVEGIGDSCELNAGSDLVGQSKLKLGLQALAFSGGDTPTHQLTANSVARGQGVPAICESVKIDQLFRNRSSMCNSGADESDTVFADSFETRKN